MNNIFHISVIACFVGVTTPTACRAQFPPPGDADFINQRYYGRVNELTKDSITIEAPEETWRRYGWGPDGRPEETKVVVPAQAPRRFPVSEALASGQVPREPRQLAGRPFRYNIPPSYMYRLTDVKVGDWVHIKYARVARVEICDHIQIEKRPGGRVPPLPDGVEAAALRIPPGLPIPEFTPYHERKKAYWDAVDKDNPHPEKMGNLRPLAEVLGRVAPAPRLVRPREIAPAPREATRSGK